MDDENLAPAATPAPAPAPTAPDSAAAAAPEADAAAPDAEDPQEPAADAPKVLMTGDTPLVPPLGSLGEAVDDTAPQADGVPPASPDHTITHRSFAREDANAPMPVTVITTRDSLRASLET